MLSDHAKKQHENEPIQPRNATRNSTSARVAAQPHTWTRKRESRISYAAQAADRRRWPATRYCPIIAILAAMLLPALTKAKLKATGISCMNNTKQLQLAHILYANDNEDYMLGPTAAPGLPDWCQVSASSMPQATDVARLKTTPTWSYLNSVASFHCPADKIPLSAGGVLVQPLRSYSMNVLIGKVPTPYAGIELALISSRIYRRSVKYSGFGHPGPSDVFVLWDEHENSINDEETFPFTGPQTLTHGTALTWLDAPSGRHGNAAGISFADGHAEIRKWKSDLTKVISPRQQGNGNVSFLPKVSQADWQWFPEHIASRGK